MPKPNKIEAFRKFSDLAPKAKALFFEAVWFAIFYRIIISILPFRLWSKYIPPSTTSLSDNYQNSSEAINLIFRAMRRSSVYLPFKEKCLIEALVMKKMLYRRQIRSTLCLGLAKDVQNDLMAHAWLIHNNEIVAGMKGAKKFTEIKRYE